jgi:hypothetical protein
MDSRDLSFWYRQARIQRILYKMDMVTAAMMPAADTDSFNDEAIKMEFQLMNLEDPEDN